MVLQGLLTFASSLVIGAVALVGICYTVNYVHNRLHYEEPARPAPSNPSSSKWNGYDSWESTTCTVCLDPIEAKFKRQLPCGHQFHGSCIAGWVRDTNQCPNCRKTIA